MLRKQNGMSLIQVIIALGLMSVIGLGVAELMVVSTKINQRSEIKLSQLILVNEIQAISSRAQTCSAAVSTINPPQQFNAAQAASINGWNLKFNTSTETIEAGYPIIPGLTVDRLYFKIPNTTPVDNTGTERVYLGKVYISFDVTENVLGGSLKQKELGSFYIRERIADSVVVGCEREAEIPISEVCTNNLGGTYDSATGNCTLPPGAPLGSECTPGDTRILAASCTNNDYSGGMQKQNCIDGYWVNSGGIFGCAWSCFIAETTIKMYNMEELPIYRVQVGDYVVGEDGAINEVFDIEVVPLGTRQLFSFNDGPHFVTAEHPFKTTLGWKSFSPEDTYHEHFFMVDKIPLEAGDLLYREDKNVEMLKKISTRHDKSNLMVYNLRLRAAPISPYNDSDDRSNTYFANGYLVHNK
ncbi:MAG: hypothetical protein MK008_12970 [Bdellovibrionales bacterium]|nr:hypothetical protein [Bdellovibrionales bacterium]